MAKKRAPAKKPAKSMTPYLTIKGAAAAIEFYKAAFGATEVSRDIVPGTETIQHAELKICGASIFVCDEFPEFGIFSPLSTGASSSMIDLCVNDAEKVWTKALEAGAVIVAARRNVPWGGSSGKLVDPFGHYWSVSGAEIEVENQTKDEAPVEVTVPVQCVHTDTVPAAA